MTEPNMSLVELACWTATALLPFLAWINGPAVSPDQAVIRWIVAIATVATAIAIRVRKLYIRKRVVND